MSFSYESANQVERTKKTGGFSSVLPPGEYEARINEVVFSPNRNQTGHWLRVRFEVQDAEYKGKWISRFYNVDHPNENVVERARRDLDLLLDAIKMKGFKDEQALMNKSCKLLVDIDRDDATKNRIVDTLPSERGGSVDPRAAEIAEFFGADQITTKPVERQPSSGQPWNNQ